MLVGVVGILGEGGDELMVGVQCDRSDLIVSKRQTRGQGGMTNLSDAVGYGGREQESLSLGDLSVR